jgi:hypothetical protein
MLGFGRRAVPFNPNWLVGKYVACLGYVKQDFRDVIEAIGSGKFFSFAFW